MKIKILSLLFLLLVFGNCYSAALREWGKLEESCENNATIYFQSHFAEEYFNYNKEHTSYTNHYNKKLNKCFILLRLTNETDKGIWHTKKLHEMDNNREYAYIGFLNVFKQGDICKVLDKKCRSESEWDSLVKPYMDE